MKAASIQAAQNITRDSYWFSEHPPTAFLIRELSKVYLDGQGHTIDHIRQLWQKEMEKMGIETGHEFDSEVMG